MLRGFVLVAVLGIALLMGLVAFGWGTDKLVYEGTPTCFDVDYDAAGAIYAVLQENNPPDYRLRVYASYDHGEFWNWIAESDPIGAPLQKIRLLTGEVDGEMNFYVLYINPLLYPRMWTRAVDRFIGDHGRAVTIRSIAGSDPAAFDVARSYDAVASPYVEEGAAPRDWFSIVFVYRAQAKLEFYRSEFRRAVDAGNQWEHVHTQSDVTPSSIASADFVLTWYPTDRSFDGFSTGAYMIVYPRSLRDVGSDCYLLLPECHSLYRGHNSSDGSAGEWSFSPYQLVASRPTGGWGFSDFAGYPAVPCDPVLAHAMGSAGGTLRWIICAQPDSTGNNALRIYGPRLSSDGGYGELVQEWQNVSGTAAYGADIGAYQYEPWNPYVNMIWVVDSVARRDVMWAWSSADLPSDWRDQTGPLNDHDAHSWPRGLSPKLVYSPGAPSPGGGGFVYAGYGPSNLYFDAPWLRFVTSPR